jgi:hypothetical protein
MGRRFAVIESLLHLALVREHEVAVELPIDLLQIQLVAARCDRQQVTVDVFQHDRFGQVVTLKQAQSRPYGDSAGCPERARRLAGRTNRGKCIVHLHFRDLSLGLILLDRRFAHYIRQ